MQVCALVDAFARSSSEGLISHCAVVEADHISRDFDKATALLSRLQAAFEV